MRDIGQADSRRSSDVERNATGYEYGKRSYCRNLGKDDTIASGTPDLASGLAKRYWMQSIVI